MNAHCASVNRRVRESRTKVTHPESRVNHEPYGRHALAGLLVATLGPPVALLGTGAAFALAALVTLAVPDSTARDEDHQPAAEATAETPSGYWRQLRDGFRFVATDPLLRRFLGLILIVNMLDAARSGPLLPLYSTQYLGGAASLGIIVAVFGGCALAGSLLFGFVAHRVHRRSTFVLCLALVALSLLPPALGLGMAWMVGVSVISGLAAGALNPIIGAVRLERVPPAMRARVFGLLTAGSWAGMPIGALLGGTSAQLIGVTGTFAVLFGVYLLAALWPCRGGAWRLMERDGST
ncbi:MFS transporter [Mycetocola reblochoni]|uniref:MFS transporter n=2 Tax=Mycetocola reblochoni TaxID=331618 RepID=A0A3L6ZLY3_9MICO|nr:MFS transporter [Mycetocola reblochoni]RLP68541.1 MFS transporter [Mycetocola reblochoni]